MPATPQKLNITEEDLSKAGSGAYSELEVPGDFEGYLADVTDYDKRSMGKSHGWIFHYKAIAPSGREVPFDKYLSFGQNARGILVDILRVHGVEIEDSGAIDVDPNSLIGDAVMLKIDFPRDRDTGEPTSDYREIRSVMPPDIDSPYEEPDAL